jgi:membrane associated rhomboid family serine protease
MEISFTLIIIGVMVATSLAALNNKTFYNAWIFNPTRIDSHKEYYRFLSSGFIHANYLHLFVNLFTLYFFGRFIEYNVGGFHMLTMLFLGIVISDFPSYSKYRNDPGYRSLGASGGVSSIVFSYIMLSPVSTIYLFFIPVPAFIFGGLFLMYSYYQSKGESGDNVNHTAHFYGSVVGILYTLLVRPEASVTFFEQLISWRIF